MFENLLVTLCLPAHVIYKTLKPCPSIASFIVYWPYMTRHKTRQFILLHSFSNQWPDLSVMPQYRVPLLIPPFFRYTKCSLSSPLPVPLPLPISAPSCPMTIHIYVSRVQTIIITFIVGRYHTTIVWSKIQNQIQNHLKKQDAKNCCNIDNDDTSLIHLCVTNL